MGYKYDTPSFLPLLWMAYVWEIVGLYKDYSLPTPLYNSATIQAISAGYSVTNPWVLYSFVTCYC
jgi:hypothetical protein